MAGKNIFVIQLVHINSAVWISLSRKECRVVLLVCRTFGILLSKITIYNQTLLKRLGYKTFKTWTLRISDLSSNQEKAVPPTTPLPFLITTGRPRSKKENFKNGNHTHNERKICEIERDCFQEVYFHEFIAFFPLEMFLNCDWNAAQFCTINSAQLPPFLLCKCHCFLFRGSRFCHPRKKRLFCEMESF